MGGPVGGASVAWSAKLVIRLARGLPGTLETHCRTVRALGLRKVNQTVIWDNTPTIRGMVNQLDCSFSTTSIISSSSGMVLRA
ncbi:unnamed protein product [Calypogeia fissa]